MNLVALFYVIYFRMFLKFKFEWIFRIVLGKSYHEYFWPWRLIVAIYIIFFPFWADPMTINMSHCFFESRGNSADSGDGSLDTTINQIGFSILTWHVLMNLHFPFLPNASIILVWSWPKILPFQKSKMEGIKMYRAANIWLQSNYFTNLENLQMRAMPYTNIHKLHQRGFRVLCGVIVEPASIKFTQKACCTWCTQRSPRGTQPKAAPT